VGSTAAEIWRLDTCCCCYITTCQWCSRVILDHCSTRYKIGVVPCILSPIIRAGPSEAVNVLVQMLDLHNFVFSIQKLYQKVHVEDKKWKAWFNGCLSCFSCKLVECSYRKKAARKQGFELSFSLSCSVFLKWVVIIFSGNFTG